MESLAEQNERLLGERDLMHADLGALLRALGMFDGARPESPHEVMWRAIGEVARLRVLTQPRCSFPPDEQLEQATATLLDAFPISRALAQALAEIILSVTAAGDEARLAWEQVGRITDAQRQETQGTPA